MPHLLEIQYGLTAQELLTAIEKRFRLKVALEGAVAEVHFERKLNIATREGWLSNHEAHDIDGMHDFTIHTLRGKTLRVEVKTIRNGSKPKVEIQKTRASKEDASSRYYDVDHFDVIAVCLGRHTGDWSQFAYCLTHELPRHKTYRSKLAVMHDVPLLGQSDSPRWFTKLQDLMDAHHG
jgi:hypothetical protein